ncbi:hypothetical protein M0R45_035016 [Rubus argutus]|uniref:Uncharacterized protein n=1 Tax=Rubus argutus TaxID=59490 RepID=A0AAW1VW26_RUBAR
MPGISIDDISHKLSISQGAYPIKQKRRAYDEERYQAIQAEVQKLQQIGFIRETNYPQWISNVVMVKKSTGKWRMCVDFTNLNKACPKHSFPLPRIDQLVDATAGHELLSFMNAYSGYNQIMMHPEDQEATTDKGLYCYKVIPFGLKNAGATYQRLVNMMFTRHIGNIVEVYVDDMLVKSVKASGHIANLQVVFNILKQYRMRLNPPKSWVQYLTGTTATLSRFISKSTDKCNAFFKLLKRTKRKEVDWSEECEQAFQNIKTYLSSIPLLSTPVPDDTLYVPIGILNSGKLSPDPDGRGQGVSRRLRPYFQAHNITVLTDQPLRLVLQRPETSGRLTKWAIELSEFDILYKGRTSTKGQAVADFISEFTHATVPREMPIEESSAKQSPWNLFVDGSSNQQASGAGVILTEPGKTFLEYALRFDFKASNNMAEYEALVAGVQLALDSGADSLNIFSDSQLVVNQVTGEFQTKDLQMTAYLGYMQILLRMLKFYNISQIPREKNSKADALARLATADPSLLPGNYPAIEHLSKPSISRTFSEVFAVEQTTTWMDPILQYKLEGKLPGDKLEARRLILRSSRYNIQDGKLYKRGLSMPNLRCIPRAEGEAVLQDIHSGPAATTSANSRWPTRHFASATSGQLSQRMPAKSPRHAISKLPIARGQFKYAIVAVDYSIKWVEAAPLTAITTTKVNRFLWKNIYCRFGVPDTIITDNGTQFDNDDLREFTSKMGTKILYSSPAHSQTNGQVEAVMKQVIPPPTGLRPTWEGPFELTEESSPGTFYLRKKDGETSRHPGNTERLRYYYK